MNRNRILGITVLLAVLALGLAFISCPQDNEERELTFINQTKVQIVITTDGTPAILTLPAPSNSTEETRGTVKKTGSDIKLISITSTSKTINTKPFAYLDLSISVTGGKVTKTGVELGSGSIVILAQALDEDGNPYGNNANPAQWSSKISAIELDE